MRLCFLMVAIACNGFLFSQDYNIKLFTTADGLPSANIYAVTFDSRGYMWLGSEAGFSRFDGSSFRNYTKDDLQNNLRGSIYEDNDHRLWAMGAGKVYLFEAPFP